jgi:hypothetical protein
LIAERMREPRMANVALLHDWMTLFEMMHVDLTLCHPNTLFCTQVFL